MSRGAQILIVVLVLAVVTLGGLLLTRAGQSTGGPTSGNLVVYAPCGMNGPLQIASQKFRELNPDVPLQVVYDNANVLVRNIRRGDRPDVFISPGEIEMGLLAAEGFIDEGTVTDFGTLDLVVIAPDKTKGLNSIRGLTSPTISTISLADPEHNSIGFYAKEALETLGLWDQLQTKLLLREYPLEAVTLATTGEVDAGIHYLTCPLETNPEKADASGVRIVEKLPRDAYPPVRLQVAMLNETRQTAYGQRYIDFLVSPEGQQAVATSGILPIEVIQ
jgi:molybdate transport system substrate-binding protein